MNHPEGVIVSQRAPEPVGPYPHGRRVGNLIFVSGIGPRRRGETAIPGVRLQADGGKAGYDFEVQCRSTLDNIRMILEDAGSSLDEVVDVTVYLTNMRDDFQTMNRIYAEYFTTNRPARTTVEVTALPTPIAVEIKVVAHCPRT
jgi:2-aminomuconate deaminase